MTDFISKLPKAAQFILQNSALWKSDANEDTDPRLAKIDQLRRAFSALNYKAAGYIRDEKNSVLLLGSDWDNANDSGDTKRSLLADKITITSQSIEKNINELTELSEVIVKMQKAAESGRKSAEKLQIKQALRRAFVRDEADLITAIEQDFAALAANTRGFLEKHQDDLVEDLQNLFKASIQVAEMGVSESKQFKTSLGYTGRY